MTIKRIKVKETQRYHEDFEGSLESIIASLQAELDAGWIGLDIEYYGYDGGREYYLYKHREENDQEYNERVKQLEKEEVENAKAKKQKLQQLKKELANLTEDELKQLGVK